MKMKAKFYELQRQLASGSFVQTQPNLAGAMSLGLNFLLGFTLSAVPLSGQCGPFGVAAAARSGGGAALLCALGASCGYFTVFGFQTGVKYAAAVMLVFITGLAIRDTALKNRFYFMPSVACFVSILTALLGYLSTENGPEVLLPVLSEGILAFGCAYFYREALQTEECTTDASELRRGISVAVLIAGILMALSGIVIAQQISLGRVIAMICVMLIAFRSGPLSGGCMGLLLGLAMDAAAVGTPFYGLAYAISGIIGGLFAKRGVLAFLISFLSGCVLTVFGFLNAGLHLELFYENFIAAVVFAVLPAKTRNKLGLLLKSTQETGGESGLRRYSARRLKNLSSAFHELFDTVNVTLSQEVNDEDLSAVFDRASEQVCSHCKCKTACWNGDYLDTLSVFNDAGILIQSRGKMKFDDLPLHFIERCQNPQELVSAVNGELRGRTYRRQFRARLEENRTAAYEQYREVAEVLADFSEELENSFGPDALVQRRLSRYLDSLELEGDLAAFRDRSGRLHIQIESPGLSRLLRDGEYMLRLSEAAGVRLCRPFGSDDGAEGRITLMEAEPFSVSVGVATMKKSGESVSGDRGTYFKTEQGTLCIILSDGMGSGESAAKESVAAVGILEKFLRNGIEPALAMRMLNSVMLLRNGDAWGFATADLLCIDLFSGDAVFYKFGAAPSFLKSGKQIRRISCENLAVGLSAGDNSAPDSVRLRMRPGNVAVIASDGVIAETNDGWVKELLMENDGLEMKELAKLTLQTAVRKYGCSDDMTVLTVKLEQRK